MTPSQGQKESIQPLENSSWRYSDRKPHNLLTLELRGKMPSMGARFLIYPRVSNSERCKRQASYVVAQVEMQLESQ
jgi:hypothetical protein